LNTRVPSGDTVEISEPTIRLTQGEGKRAADVTIHGEKPWGEGSPSGIGPEPATENIRLIGAA